MDASEYVKNLYGSPFSEPELRQEMRKAGFAPEAISSALLWLHPDWRRQAVLAARQLAAEKPPLSRRALRESLKSRGFQAADAAFALKALAVSWPDRAAETPIPDREDRAEYLHLEEYTDEEILLALRRPEDEEDAARLRALCLLGQSPLSRSALRSALTEETDARGASETVENLGDIWEEQAMLAATRLLGRYGALLSKKRLLQFLNAQHYTLDEIAAVLRNLDVDWDEQALQCALYCFRSRNLAGQALKSALKDSLFTAGEIRRALHRLKDLEKKK